MMETPTEAREPDLPNSRASETAPRPSRKSTTSVARAQRLMSERAPSLAAGPARVNRNILTLQAISPYHHWMPPTRLSVNPSLRSMTGFGRAEGIAEGFAVTVEARSVNHRHLDIALRLPRALAAVEMDARRLIQSRLERGRVDVAVQLAPAPGQSSQQIAVDAALAAQFIAQARELGRAVGLGGDVTLAWVLERPGVMRLVQEAETSTASVGWPMLADVLGRALDELVTSRATEGEALGTEFQALHAALRAQVDAVAARTPAALARYQERLRERIAALLGETVVDH